MSAVQISARLLLYCKRPVTELGGMAARICYGAKHIYTSISEIGEFSYLLH